MNALDAEVVHNLQTACQLAPDRPIVVGVSGGPDSMCLLETLHKSEIPLVVAHLDHQVRRSSASEAAFVQKQAAVRDLNYVGTALDVPGYAAEHNLSVEEAARTLRYRFLFDTARQASAQAVAVGHTADDQVETVLMHLIQGAGLRGLRGMSVHSYLADFSEEVPLVRPLLSLWRTDILAYCNEIGLQTVEDLSNRDPAYTRNRVRNILIPMLETFNPRVRESIWRMSQVIAGEEAVNLEAHSVVWKKCLREAGPGYLVFQRPVWLALGQGFQRGLLRKGLDMIGDSGQGIGFRGVEAALDFIALAGNLRREKDLGQVQLVCEGDAIWLLRSSSDIMKDDFPQLPPETVRQINIPGVIQLSGSWCIGVRPVADLSAAQIASRENQNPFRAWVDAGPLGYAPLQVRTRVPGDRLRPLGMDGQSQKLSDFMINEKIPQRARARWPLITAGDELVWVPGFRLAHPYRLTGQTEHAIYLYLKKGGEGGN